MTRASHSGRAFLYAEQMTFATRDTVIRALVDWCKEERISYRLQLELMESGKIGTSECRNGRMENSTPETIKRVKGLIAELDKLLAEHGYA